MTDSALKHVYTGKVRELYEVAHDRLLMVASDRVSVFDVVLPDEIPDKGRVLTGLSSWWFEHTAAPRAEPRDLGRPHRLPRGRTRRRGPGDARAFDATDTARVRRARVRVRARLETSTSQAGTVGGQAVPNGTRASGEAARAAVHADDEGRRGSRRVARPRRRHRARRRRALREAPRALAAALRVRCAPRAIVRRDPRRHEVRVRRARRRDPAHRRGDDARLVARTGRSTSTGPVARRRRSTSSSYATTWTTSAGTGSSPPPHLPPDVIENTRGRYVEAYETITGQNFDEWFGPL